MNLLLDTHLLLWLAARDDMMSPRADALVKDLGNTLWFSVASLVAFSEPVIALPLRANEVSVAVSHVTD